MNFHLLDHQVIACADFKTRQIVVAIRIVIYGSHIEFTIYISAIGIGDGKEFNSETIDDVLNEKNEYK